MNSPKIKYTMLEFIKNLDYNVSYDYSDLLEDLQEDIVLFNAKNDDVIKIVREQTDEVYKPIIDYYFDEDDILEQDIDNLEEITLQDLKAELNYLNDIIKNSNMFDKSKN